MNTPLNIKTKEKRIKVFYGKTQVTKNAYCPICKEITMFAIHGVDENGKLWKGHLCVCNCWNCLKCGKVFKPKEPDDKEYSWDCCR